jgi:small-conductance mechanosensitive channel
MTTPDHPDLWILLSAAVLGFSIALGVRLVLLHYARKRGSAMAAAIVQHATLPLLLLLPALLARLVQPLFAIEARTAPVVRHAVTLFIIVVFAWLLIALSGALDDLLRERLLAGARDDRHARRILTRMGILHRVLTALIVFLAAAGMLATFPEMRAVGTSILASAGIAGIVLGLAARPAVETLLAGLQIALTEPFSIDDVVVVEGEWGRIEEITSTHVVVRVWDLRRLVLPLSYFLQKPFQNWTRSGVALLAQVTLEVDYSTPVEAVRREAGAIVTSSPLWNGVSWNLQVTEAGDRTMRLRVVASAADSDRAWDLRCEIREKLIRYMQERHPEALPRVRATIEGAPAAEGLLLEARKRDDASGRRP